MARAHNSGTSDPGSSPGGGGGGGGGGVIVFVLEKGTLYSHSASVLPGLASLLGGSSNTPDRFMLLMLEICAALIGY